MRKLVVLLVSGLLLLGTACGGSSSNPPAANNETPQETESGPIEVAMTEFAFAGPETVPAEAFEVTAVNNGEQPHMMGVIPLKEGAPPVEELARMNDKELQKYAAGEFGGTKGVVKPGEEQTFTLDAPEAALYAFACFVKDPETKKPHVQLGMLGSFEVEG